MERAKSWTALSARTKYVVRVNESRGALCSSFLEMSMEPGQIC